MPNHSASLDLMFHALGDPTRRAVVARLAQGPATVSDLAKPLAMALPSVMQHLKLLEESGLIRSEKIGRVRTCRIEPASMRMVEQWVIDRRATWERRFDRLGEYLASTEPEKE
jgi:DNA-binding transcriptional ArsR family regulator